MFLEEGKKALLVCKEGEVRELTFEKEGRMLVKIGVGEEDLGRTARPGGEIGRADVRVARSGAANAGGKEGEIVFIGGTGGEGVLLRIGREGGGEAVKVETFLRETMQDEEVDGMDVEDGESHADLVSRSRTLALTISLSRRPVRTLDVCDEDERKRSLPRYTLTDRVAPDRALRHPPRPRRHPRHDVRVRATKQGSQSRRASLAVIRLT